MTAYKRIASAFIIYNTMIDTSLAGTLDDIIKYRSENSEGQPSNRKSTGALSKLEAVKNINETLGSSSGVNIVSKPLLSYITNPISSADRFLSEQNSINSMAQDRSKPIDGELLDKLDRANKQAARNDREAWRSDKAVYGDDISLDIVKEGIKNTKEAFGMLGGALSTGYEMGVDTFKRQMMNSGFSASQNSVVGGKSKIIEFIFPSESDNFAPPPASRSVAADNPRPRPTFQPYVSPASAAYVSETNDQARARDNLASGRGEPIGRVDAQTGNSFGQQLLNSALQGAWNGAAEALAGGGRGSVDYGTPNPASGGYSSSSGGCGSVDYSTPNPVSCGGIIPTLKGENPTWDGKGSIGAGLGRISSGR